MRMPWWLAMACAIASFAAFLILVVLVLGR